MEHGQAVDEGIAERYVLGQLSDEERSGYEEHYFECPECADELESVLTFVANAREAWRTSSVVRPVSSPVLVMARRWGALFWPAPAGAVAALVLVTALAGYQAVRVVPDLRTTVTETEAALSRANAPWVAPRESTFLAIERGEPRVVRVATDTRRATVRLSLSSSHTFPYYRCDLVALDTDGDSEVRSSGVVSAPPPGLEMEVVVSVSNLTPGPHAIVLHGLESAAGEVVAPAVSEYRFRFERIEED